jgi:putative MATE family efflux protein
MQRRIIETIIKSFNLFKRSLKGGHVDYTSGSISRAVIMLAIPMILEMSMESVLALVDLFFVGHLPNSEHTLQTVALTESALTIIYSLAIGMSMAATAIVARRVGEKHNEGAAISAMQSIWLSLFIVIPVSIAGFFFAPSILRIMGAEQTTINIGINYMRIMMGASIVIMLLFLINGIFRGAGNASMAMRSLWLANICNIILCPLFINGFGFIPAMGVTGAAVATSAGRGIGVLYQLYYLRKGAGVIKIKKRHVKIDAGIITALVRIASPATLQFIIGSCSWIVLARLVAQTGHSVASAGYQTAIRVVMFFILPAWGMSNAAATLVGQNLGAGKPLRAEASVITTAKYNAIFMAIVSLVFLIGAEPIISVFTNEDAVQTIAVKALRIVTTGYVFYGIGMVMTSAFNGAGDTLTPTKINLVGFWLFQIPFAYLMALYFSFGPTGVFIAIPVTETGTAIVAFILFRTGRWKTVRV